MGFRDWFRKPPPSRIESRIEFIGEQDGENERRFKAQLLPLLEEESYAFLDVGFLTPLQEDDLARVCPPFYQTRLQQS